MKPKVIAIVGPTASGKSVLGVFLAKKLGGEIISADSRQVYTGMRIISRAEPGHMVGIADPRRQFSAGAYARKTRTVITRIRRSGRTSIVVGGAGFYIEALLHGTLPNVAPDKTLRKRLNKKTARQLFAQLQKLDPARARHIDPHNKVRIIRAIEIAQALGQVPRLSPATNYEALWLGLREPKNLRAGVEARLRAGMVAEAKKLRAKLSSKRYAELGFECALLADYLDKKITKQELIEQMINGERKYAKRQMRWFKRNKSIHWVRNKREALRLAQSFLSR